MSKPVIEIHSLESVPWKPVMNKEGVAVKGMSEKVLSKNPDNGVTTRLIKVEPGVETFDVSSHDNVGEEVYIIRGGIIDKRNNLILTEGMYGCRPPGTKHGPYSFPIGALILEFRYKD